jgi:16S rRNA (guanine527-N7)-methyltransferase
VGTVSRETLEAVVHRWDLSSGAVPRFERLLGALEAEPDPHTTVRDPAQAVDVHIRDSLSALDVSALRSAASVVDIGSGAGFPGLPLAIALPRTRFDLVEAASRKTAVIERLAAAAGLDNARPVHARAEDWAGGEGAAAYDVATARAVAPLAILVEYGAPLLRVGGTFIAWKGRPDGAEIAAGAAAAAAIGLRPLDPLPVTPFEGARDLHLYLYSKVGDTPTRFPRRPGLAAKRPLSA